MSSASVSASTPSPPIIRAIDIGYGNTKFVIDNHGACRLFPSLAPRAQTQSSAPSGYRERRTAQVWVDGEPYEVGPDSTLFSNVSVLHADYLETPQYRALLYGALDAMQVSHIDLLVTGLPVQLYASRWQRLKTLLTGTHIIRPGVTVHVKEAAVVIQPLGGFLTHAHARGRWSSAQERTHLLIDPGYYSFDWMTTRGMKEIPGLSGSEECGVAKYLKAIEDALNQHLGEAHSNLRRLDEGLRLSNFRYKGQPVDLEPYREHAQGIIAQALCALCNCVGAGQEVDEIVLVGGGSAYFLAGIRATFPHHPLTLVEEPVYANVRGFQLIGDIVQRRQAA